MSATTQTDGITPQEYDELRVRRASRVAEETYRAARNALAFEFEAFRQKWGDAKANALKALIEVEAGREFFL